MKKQFLLFFIFLFAMSCSDKNGIPKSILPKEKMQAVLWDMISAGEFLNTYVLPKDSLNKLAQNSAIYGQVFQVNHITREEFDKSYSYYRRHPILMKTILDSMSKRQAPVIIQPPLPIQKKDSLKILAPKKDSLNFLRRKMGPMKKFKRTSDKSVI